MLFQSAVYSDNSFGGAFSDCEVSRAEVQECISSIFFNFFEGSEQFTQVG